MIYSILVLMYLLEVFNTTIQSMKMFQSNENRNFGRDGPLLTNAFVFPRPSVRFTHTPHVIFYRPSLLASTNIKRFGSTLSDTAHPDFSKNEFAANSTTNQTEYSSLPQESPPLLSDAITPLTQQMKEMIKINQQMLQTLQSLTTSIDALQQPQSGGHKRWKAKTNEDLKWAVKMWLKDPYEAEYRIGHISKWDTSSIADMFGLFSKGTTFNEDISDWNVSNVTDMQFMFYNCTEFNQPLNKWNVSNVRSMNSMFRECKSFNQPLNQWDVSNVDGMMYMFCECSDFNQPLNNWNVETLTTASIMFCGCTNFNQPLHQWDVRNVVDMSNMFSCCETFNQPLNSWNVSNVKDAYAMFRNCKQFNQPLNNWKTSSLTNVELMFAHCKDFNQPLDQWDVSKVVHCDGMFLGCDKFKQSLDAWTLSQRNKARLFMDE